MARLEPATFPEGYRTCHNRRVAAGGATEIDFRARAGALTLSYLRSGLGRETLLAVLAQAATGAELVAPEDLVEDKSEAERINEVFADRFLVEPVNPADDPDDPETVMQPTPAGREVPLVGAALHRWLQSRLGSPVGLGKGSSDPLWALLAGWSSTVIHALAAGPRTEDEVQEAVGVLDAREIDARLALLAEVGLLHVLPGEDGEPRFEATEWLRLAVGPLAAAARMELRHPCGDTAPIAAADAEAALRLTLPLLRMKSGLSGSCALEVELDEEVLGSPVAMTARVEEGRVAACEPGADPAADASISGTTAAWLDAVIDDSQAGLATAGDWRLPRDLLGGLHEMLFGGHR